MGCDGGTIPKRDELVKTKKKPEQKDKASELSFRWQHCALSQSPLQVPVVACELGRIYSKESIIENLLEKSSTTAAEPATVSSSSVVSHIRSLKDVKTLNLTENPAWTETTEVGDGYIDNNKSQWMCPVSGHSMNGKFRFVFPWTCGCVFSEKALEMTTKGQKDGPFECLKCQKPFELSDIVVLNPTEESEIEALRTKMEIRRAANSKSKSKKSKKNQSEATDSNGTVSGISSSGSSSSATASFSTPTAGKEKRKLNGETNGVKKSKLDAPGPSIVSKISTNYSVAKDPRASETFKSLFTSSEKAKVQDRAHWVTYNPFYN